MTETKTLLSLAQEIQAQLTTITRNDGNKAVVFKDKRPDWMQEFSHAVHGDTFPDDDVYRFMEKAIDAIVEAEPEDVDAAIEAVDEIESDIDTADLMRWFTRWYEYSDQALSDGLWSFEKDGAGVVGLVQCGQLVHIREVGYSVVRELEKVGRVGNCAPGRGK